MDKSFVRAEGRGICNLIQIFNTFLGAGWGGCIVALVPHSKVNDYMEFLQSNYYASVEKAKQREVRTYLFPTKPGPGAQVFSEA